MNKDDDEGKSSQFFKARSSIQSARFFGGDSIAAAVYFLKSSMKTATLLGLTSIDSKCNIFVYSDISIRFFPLSLSLCSFFRRFSSL